MFTLARWTVWAAHMVKEFTCGKMAVSITASGFMESGTIVEPIWDRTEGDTWAEYRPTTNVTAEECTHVSMDPFTMANSIMTSNTATVSSLFPTRASIRETTATVRSTARAKPPGRTDRVLKVSTQMANANVGFSPTLLGTEVSKSTRTANLCKRSAWARRTVSHQQCVLLLQRHTHEQSASNRL